MASAQAGAGESNDDNTVALQQVFTAFTAGEGMSGAITRERLAAELAAMNLYVPDDLVTDIIDYATEGASTGIDYKQFRRLIESIALDEGEDPTKEHYVPEASGSDANARAAKLAFTAFDRDRDRKIGVDDLRDTLVEQEYSGADVENVIEEAAKLTDNDIMGIIYSVDPDKATHISRAAFHSLLAHTDASQKQKKEVQKSPDAEEPLE